MKILIVGGSKSGKSMAAQRIARMLAAHGSCPAYYWATMEPSDSEDEKRIARHLEARAGWGFETIECGADLLTCLNYDTNGSFLLDSVTALLQNVMFPVEKNYEMDLAAAETCAKDVVAFAKSVANAVIVSDYIYSDAQRYDEGTECYRKSLAKIDRLLAQLSDTVIEVSAGQVILHKGELPV